MAAETFYKQKYFYMCTELEHTVLNIYMYFDNNTIFQKMDMCNVMFVKFMYLKYVTKF